MKHLYIGLGVLLGVLLAGILICCLLNTRLNVAVDTLTDSLDAAWAGNEAGAREALAQAQGTWDELRRLAFCFLDHGELEAAEQQLSRLTAAAQAGQWDTFTVECQALLTLLGQILQNELPVLENIL